MTDRQYDVFVVGAGIHGAGVAQAACARGYRVLLIEQARPAAGTSSRSSKLIHGGLRYLESAQFRIVRECLRERELLLKLAPELVRPLRFHLPVYRGARRGTLLLGAGLTFYAAFSGFGPHSGFGFVPRREWASLDGIGTEGLRAVLRYTDAQTDDAALTRAVLRSAQSLGAEFLCPAEFMRAVRRGDRWEIAYREGARDRRCIAGTLVLATGPWLRGTLERIAPRPAIPPFELVQGTHLVVEGTLDRGAYYAEHPADGRGVFALPWQGSTLLGTTETPFHGDPATVAPLPQEESYLLEAWSRLFPQRRAAVRERFAGLRVLPGGEDAIFHRPRDLVLVTDDDARPRLVGILGGKLTTYRLSAARVVERLGRALPERRARADTRRLKLAPE